MDEFYLSLIDAFATSATKLELNETSDGEPKVCKESMKRLWCEVQVSRAIFWGQLVNNRKIILTGPPASAGARGGTGYWS